VKEIIISGRCLTVTHVGVESTEHGDIQRYRVDVSDSDATTRLSILRASRTVDARVLASVIETELLLDYPGSSEDGVLRDRSVREWRDENRIAIEAALGRLRADIAQMQPEHVSDIERALLRAFDMDPDAPDSHGA
jgi:hypothetical protein